MLKWLLFWDFFFSPLDLWFSQWWGQGGGLRPAASEPPGDLFVVVQSLSCVQLFFTHGLQHPRLPCPLLSPGICSNSCPLSWWCHPLPPPSPFLPSVFPSIRVFSNESALCIRWPKYWSFSFSISPSSEYSGLSSLRMHWFDLLAVQGTLKGFPHHRRSKAPILWRSAEVYYLKNGK